MAARYWLGAITSTFIILGSFGACSEGPGESLVDPCKASLAGLCGQDCSGTDDCPDGLYCADGACTADCTPDEGQCVDGFQCSGDGMCVESFTGFGDDVGGGGNGNGGSGNGSLDGCTDLDVPFDETTPSVLILVDQSGSMNEDFGSGTRWSVLYDALMNQSDGVVYTLSDRVRFGLSLYTSDGGNAGGDCPMLTSVPIALDNYEAIDDVYSEESPRGDTPTAESIEAATQILEDFDEPGPKYILLVTDGLPDNCEDADAHDAESQAMSVAAVQAAHDAGIELIAMGLSDDIATQGAGPGHLQDLANAGAGLPTDGSQDARYYVASDDPDQLSSQFQAIIGGIRTCTFDLAGSVDPALAHLGRVVLDGTALTLDDPDGWELTSPRQIEIVGEACEQIKSSASSLSITFPCDSGAVDIDIR